MPHLQAVNTSNKEDTTNNLKLRTDVSVYNRVEGVTLTDRTDFSKMEPWMEFKTNGIAFQDPSSSEPEESRQLAITQGLFTPNTAEGIYVRGQLAHYAGAQHSLQFRHFSFSILVEGDEARFLRWEPTATIVTTAFNYRTSPRLMAESLWRFDHLSAGERGHDESVQPANLPPEVDVRVRAKLGIDDKNVPLYPYTLPGLIGKGYAYGPRSRSQIQSLVSRCTRNLPVVWIPNVDIDEENRPCASGASDRRSTDPDTGGDESSKKGPWCEERIIYMKDTWRFLSDEPDTEVMREHEIYELLYAHDTPNIPRNVVGGDVVGGNTRSQEFLNAPWLCVKPRISLFQHYRLAHAIVGRALTKFDSTKKLVTAVSDAMKGTFTCSYQSEELLTFSSNSSFTCT